MANSIIYNQNIPTTTKLLGGSSTFRLDRLNLLDKATADELNTYRNWGTFDIIHEGAGDETQSDGSLGQQYKLIGVKPLFNTVNAIGAETNYQLQNNAPLLDTPSIRDQIRAKGDCSIKALVKDSELGNMGRAIYQYSDFMYCKYLGRVSNNYLVTLRRFPFPCGDHINFTDPMNNDERGLQKHMPDVGRLVTWMGTPGNDMSNILKFSVLMPYKDMEAQMETPENDTAESGGLLGSFMNLANPKYTNMVVQGQAGKSTLGMMEGLAKSKFSGRMQGMSNYQGNEWMREKDRMKIWGPSADVIAKTSMRQDPAEGGGLQFEQEISLVFDYELRSYDGINGKAAFLDLLANILAVTYSNGKFWGGGYKSAGASQSNAFANLPIYKLGQGGRNPVDFHTVTDAFMDSVKSVGAAFNGGREISSASDVLNAIRNFGKGVINTLIGGAINMLGRPQKQVLNSLLTPAPVGLWHLMIGNPKHPILSMGNMILTGVEVEQYGPLGLDDFPTGLRVSIKLKHAKPRDAMQIEQMYMMGDYRIYYPMSGKVFEIYKNSSRYKDPVDHSTLTVEDEVSTTTNADKVDQKQSTSDTETSNTTTNMTDEQKLYLKFFGTADTKLISLGASEAAWGSHKAAQISNSKSKSK